MSSISFTLLTHQEELSYAGPALRADAYYGNTDGIHTVSVNYTNFTGRLYIEGTLVLNPVESDWFVVSIDDTTAYKEYTAANSTEGFTFKMNLMNVRARVDRDYLAAGSYNFSNHGAVNKALLNV